MVGFPPYGHSKDRKYFLGPEKRQLLYVESVPMFYAFCKLLTKLIILINVKLVPNISAMHLISPHTPIYLKPIATIIRFVLESLPQVEF